MRIHNELPRLIDCLRRWTTVPPEDVFRREYEEPLEPLLRPMLEDFSRFRDDGLYGILSGLTWDEYRAEALRLDPRAEEERLARAIAAVEGLLKVPLEGEAVLFGAFTMMDGYARFDRGTHRVFLGVDESHGRGRYLDVLFTHELTHVARESRPAVWTGWGLDPKMAHDEFVARQPVIEHVLSEGVSCLVSEILNPDEAPWEYAYQTEDSLAQILQHGPALDRVIHAEIRDPNGHYHHLYDVRRYRPEMPRYAHYVWAWAWAGRVLENVAGGDPARLVGLCSKDLVDHALGFTLASAPPGRRARR